MQLQKDLQVDREPREISALEGEGAGRVAPSYPLRSAWHYSHPSAARRWDVRVQSLQRQVLGDGVGQQAPGVRAAKAAATRARVIDAARHLFVAHGYEHTTMQAIAEGAGVAVQTLYFTFKNKRTILSEVLDVAVAGDTAPVATLERPWVAEAMAAPPAELIERLVVGTGAIHARVAQVLEVVRSAAGSDPEIAELWETNLTQRHTVFVAFAGALAGKVPLRDGLTTVRAADVMLAVLSPETYGLLVSGRGWSGDEWVAWASDVLSRQLLADGS